MAAQRHTPICARCSMHHIGTSLQVETHSSPRFLPLPPQFPGHMHLSDGRYTTPSQCTNWCTALLAAGACTCCCKQQGLADSQHTFIVVTSSTPRTALCQSCSMHSNRIAQQARPAHGMQDTAVNLVQQPAQPAVMLAAVRVLNWWVFLLRGFATTAQGILQPITEQQAINSRRRDVCAARSRPQAASQVAQLYKGL